MYTESNCLITTGSYSSPDIADTSNSPPIVILSIAHARNSSLSFIYSTPLHIFFGASTTIFATAKVLVIVYTCY
jgi:hypothetical protein